MFGAGKQDGTFGQLASNSNAAGGFTFGAPTATGTTANPTPAVGGFNFGAPSGSVATAGSGQPTAATGFSFGNTAAATTGKPGGISFGTAATATAAPAQPGSVAGSGFSLTGAGMKMATPAAGNLAGTGGLSFSTGGVGLPASSAFSFGAPQTLASSIGGAPSLSTAASAPATTASTLSSLLAAPNSSTTQPGQQLFGVAAPVQALGGGSLAVPGATATTSAPPPYSASLPTASAAAFPTAASAAAFPTAASAAAFPTAASLPAASTAAFPTAASTAAFPTAASTAAFPTAASLPAASTGGALFGTGLSSLTTSKAGLATSSAATSALTGFSAVQAAPTSSLTTSSSVGVAAPLGGAKAGRQLTYKQLEEDTNKWMAELEEQERNFLLQATQVNAWDKLVLENGEKIVQLNREVERVKVEQQKLDHELDFVHSQQRELGDLLTPLEAALEAMPAISYQQHADLEREHTYQLAESLDAQLKRMCQDLKEIIDRLNSSNTKPDPDDPVHQITKILNAHMDSLLWIDRQTGNLNRQVDEMAKLMDNERKEHERNFRLAYS